MTQSNRLASEYRFLVVLATLFFSSCSGVNWGIRPTEEEKKRSAAYMENLRRDTEIQIKQIDKEHPDWAKATLGEAVLTDYYDENGKKIGSSITH